MQLAWRLRHKLPAIIDDVWHWEQVGAELETLGCSRIDKVSKCLREPCSCGGRWRYLAELALGINEVPAGDLCHAILASLQRGRTETCPVVVLMGRFGGEGKSFLLAPLKKIFGVEHVQLTPQPGSFPLLGLETKRVVLLDEWAFDAATLPMVTQLLWFEGKAFPITRPQNKDYTGHLLYQGTAPIFVTCKETDLAPLRAAANAARANDSPSEATMMLRRLKIFPFTRKLPAPEGEVVPECTRCFASLLQHHSRQAL